MQEPIIEYVLNPRLEVNLRLKTRAREEDEREITVNAVQNPSLARFLVEAAIQGELGPAIAQQALPLLKQLLDTGVLLPSQAVLRPVSFADSFKQVQKEFSAAGGDGTTAWLARDFTPCEGLELQHGSEILPSLRALAPLLGAPLDAGHCWAWSAPSELGLRFPVLLERAHLDALELCLRGAGDLEPSLARYLVEAGVLVRRQSHCPAPTAPDEGRERLRRERHAVARGLLSPFQVRVMQTHLKSLYDEGHFVLDREQVAGFRSSMHNEPVSRLLQHLLAPWVNRLVPQPVKSSYSYTTRYLPGAVLERHTDRQQCAWNISLFIESEPALLPEGSWPLYLETPEGTHAVRLEPGDAVLYEGTRTPHWRDALPDGQTATVLLGHYVPLSFEGDLA